MFSHGGDGLGVHVPSLGEGLKGVLEGGREKRVKKTADWGCRWGKDCWGGGQFWGSVSRGIMALELGGISGTGSLGLEISETPRMGLGANQAPLEGGLLETP